MRYCLNVVSGLMLFFVAATAIAVAPCTAAGQGQTQPLRFLGNKAIPPFISLEDGRPVGIVVDLAHALADRAGLSISVEGMDWATAQSELRQGRADALLQINPDPRREQIYDFSDTLLASNFQIFRKSARTDVRSLASLRGKKVGVESGGFPAQNLGDDSEFQLVLVPTWKAAFILLNTDQIDAVIVDRWVGEYELAVNRFEGITVVEPPVVRDYSRIAVAKGNRQLLDKINIGLESIKWDGTYQRIMDKWRPKEVVYFTRGFVDGLIFYAIAACGAILIAVTIRIFTHARALKKINIRLADENAARRAAERELAASHRNLECVVELRTMELRRSEERLRLFIDRAPAAIAMLDSNMCYLTASRRFVADYGLGSGVDPASLVGRSHYELFPDIPERWRAIHRRVLAGETFSAEDDPFPREDGRTDWIHWEMTPWYGPDGLIGGVLLFTEMVTARKEAEAALKQSEAELRSLNETLEARVREEVAAREELRRQATHAERIRALGQLAGGIAHDFNNVLQIIEGADALLLRQQSDPAAVARMAQLVADAVARGASITHRLLAFGRRGELRATRLDTASLLNGMQEMLVHTLGRGIDVEVRLAEDVAPIRADKGQLETALVNLATNARDAMRGGGHLTIAAGTETVSATGPAHPFALPPGRYVRLAVTDTGTGMDAATLRRAPEPFFTTKGPGAGTGLGLPMVLGFAEQSGGALDIASSPTEGTTVTLWLPTAESGQSAALEAPQATVDTPSSADGASGTTRVLLVDDEAMLREVLAEQLEGEGYSVLLAASGAEALALLQAGEPVDVVVTDLSMPGMDGLAVIRSAQEARPGLPAVLLTGYAGEGTGFGANAVARRSFSLLHKPVRAAELANTIGAIRPQNQGGIAAHPA